MNQKAAACPTCGAFPTVRWHRAPIGGEELLDVFCSQRHFGVYNHQPERAIREWNKMVKRKGGDDNDKS